MKRCVRCVLGFLSLLAAGCVGANAAEMTSLPPLPPGNSWYNWTSLYIGGNVGGAWGTTSAQGTDASPLGTSAYSGSANSSGWVAGGQAGANFQFADRWVVGAVADGDWSRISSSSSGCSIITTGASAGLASGCGTRNVQLNDFGTVRGRVGYAFSNLLFYGTGGWAWGNSAGTHTTTCVSSTVAHCPGASTTFTGGTASFSNALNGWAAGAGIEWGFLRSWTVRMEYLHVEFDNVQTGFGTTLTTARGTSSVASSISSNNGFDMVRVGLNYLFR
jgi:outer membrane immunogenic protein